MDTNQEQNLATAGQIRRWMSEFDATEAQIREAIAAVGTNPSDIELH